MLINEPVPFLILSSPLGLGAHFALSFFLCAIGLKDKMCSAGTGRLPLFTTISISISNMCCVRSIIFYLTGQDSTAIIFYLSSAFDKNEHYYCPDGLLKRGYNCHNYTLWKKNKFAKQREQTCARLHIFLQMDSFSKLFILIPLESFLCNCTVLKGK